MRIYGCTVTEYLFHPCEWERYEWVHRIFKWLERHWWDLTWFIERLPWFARKPLMNLFLRILGVAREEFYYHDMIQVDRGLKREGCEVCWLICPR